MEDIVIALHCIGCLCLIYLCTSAYLYFEIKRNEQEIVKTNKEIAELRLQDTIHILLVNEGDMCIHDLQYALVTCGHHIFLEDLKKLLDKMGVPMVCEEDVSHLN